MIEFDTVSTTFWTGRQHKVILDRVSFRVDLGHRLGIFAQNGGGKTRLINRMAGLTKSGKEVIRRGCRVSLPLGFMGGSLVDPSYPKALHRLQTACPVTPRDIETSFYTLRAVYTRVTVCQYPFGTCSIIK